MPPSDIHAESGSRLPLPKREELDPEAQTIYDHHLDPKGGSLKGLHGPGGIRLHSPVLSARQAPVSRYLRFEAGIPEPLRELAILIAARAMDSRFEWAAHEPEGLRVGLSQAAIDAVKHGGPAEGVSGDEALIIAFGRELFGEHRVTPETYARMETRFGVRMLIDIVSLMGNYAATALLLATFDVQLPEGPQALLPVG